MRNLIIQLMSDYGKVITGSVITILSTLWLRRRAKKRGESLMASIIGWSVATLIMGVVIGSAILAELAYRWKEGKWSGEYAGQLKEWAERTMKSQGVRQEDHARE